MKNMKKLTALIIILFFPCTLTAQYVKDYRYQLGGTDGLQNLRNTRFYPYPSDYTTQMKLDRKWTLKIDNSNIQNYLSGDVTGDGLIEIIVNSADYIYIISNKGELLTRISTGLDRKSYLGFIEDFDGDGINDIILGGNLNEKPVLHIYNFRMGLLDEFILSGNKNTSAHPVCIINNNIYLYIFTTYEPPYPRGIVAIDKNTKVETFHYKIGAGGGLIETIAEIKPDSLYYFVPNSNSFGNLSTGDGFNHNGTVTSDTTDFAIAIDNYGSEVFTTALSPDMFTKNSIRFNFIKNGRDNRYNLLSSGNTQGTRSRLDILNIPDGNIVSTFFYENFNRNSSCSVVDLNNDFTEELILSLNHRDQFVFDQDFNILAQGSFPLDIEITNDINNDGKPDIFCESGETLIVLDKDLNKQYSYSYESGIGRPIISDIDFNGRNEIISGIRTDELVVLEAADNPLLPAPVLSANSTPDYAFISWEYPDSIEVERFNIYRNFSPVFLLDQQHLIETVNSDIRNYRDYSAGFENSYYKIESVSVSGEKSFSSNVIPAKRINLPFFKKFVSVIISFLLLTASFLAFFGIKQYVKNKKDIVHLIKSIFKSAPFGSVIIDGSGELAHINDTGSFLLFGKNSITSGGNLLSFFTENNLSEWDKAIRTFLKESKKEVRCELPLLINGNTRSIFVLMRKFDSENRNFIHINMVDISDHLTTRTALSWTSMAHALAHEIKNPLTSIQLALESIYLDFEKDPDSGRSQEKYLKSIDEDIERIRKETNRLMQFSIGSRMKKTPVNLLQLTRRVIERYEVFKKDGIKVIMDIGDDYVVSGSEDLLELALWNIFDNSIDAMGEKGSLIIRCAETDQINENSGIIRKMISFEISDSGCGIQGDDITRIYEPRFTTKELGTGFGLSIVKHIIDDHEGFIKVNSKTGIGTTFYLYLPKYSG